MLLNSAACDGASRWRRSWPGSVGRQLAVIPCARERERVAQASRPRERMYLLDDYRRRRRRLSSLSSITLLDNNRCRPGVHHAGLAWTGGDTALLMYVGVSSGIHCRPSVPLAHARLRSPHFSVFVRGLSTRLLVDCYLFLDDSPLLDIPRPGHVPAGRYLR